jgi:REP element-mobilizing transposase RayT
LQVEGATYFLTWRCAPGIYLTEAERDVVLSALRHWDGSRCVVFAAVVMPDHVHALIHPMPKGKGARDLAEVVHGIKSYSSHRINEIRKRRGAVWQDERCDRWVRHEEEFAEKWHYIANNPANAGLATAEKAYPWLYLGAGPLPQ